MADSRESADYFRGVAAALDALRAYDFPLTERVDHVAERLAPVDEMGDGGNRCPTDWANFADRLMAAGDRLAEKLREIDGSPWTAQLLEEWAEAKDLTGWL